MSKPEGIAIDDAAGLMTAEGRHTSRFAFIALALVAGCYSPSIGNGQLRCDTNGGRCPGGFECQQGSCWRNGQFVPADLSMPSPDDGGVSDLAVTDGGGCVENTLICANATTPQKCTGGVFVNQTPCTGATPFCVGGQCVACTAGQTSYVNATTIGVCVSGAFQNQVCPTNARAASVDTAKCYDPEWAAWPMPGSGAHTPSYTAGTSTVRDNITHLVWQRGFSASALNWQSAVNYCAALGALDGLSGWRLPSRIETVSLLEVLLGSTPYIDTAAFPGTPPAGFWSSTPASGGASAWYIDFNSGDASAFAIATTGQVRCVR